MRSYVYDHVKMSDGSHLVTRYTLGDYFFKNLLIIIFYLIIVWPFQILIWWPIKMIALGIIISIEMVLRTILWLIKLPFCLLFFRRKPEF